MKALLILAAAACLLGGSSLNFNSLDAAFTQHITDDHNKTITYEGHLWAQKPQNALWHYRKPVEKMVYIVDNRVTVIEPDLEQVLIKTIGADLDIFSIWRKATEVKPDEYLATFQGRQYRVKLEGDLLASISYRDDFDNKVLIDFTDVNQTGPIAVSRFVPEVPEDYDVIDDQ